MKQRIFRLIVGLALTGASGIATDTLGLSVTPQVQACNGQGSGGGC